MADITIAPALDATIADSTAHIIYTDAATGTFKKAPISALPLSDAEVAALALKAPLASPTFTGNPTAPTQTAGNNSTRIATTEFVTAAILAAPGGGGSLTVQDEGVSLATAATTINFVGAGVTASGTGATKTITIPGGGGSIPQAALFNVIDYGADPNSAADDSAAIIAAVAACAAAGGGTVFFPLPTNTSGFHYIVSSALITSQDGINPNAQIVIPLFENTGDSPTIVFEGEVPPSFTTEGIASMPRNNQGCIIESTIQGAGGAVFGSSWYASGVWGNRNFVKVVMKNLIVRTSTMSGSTHIAGTMNAINFARLSNFLADHVKVDISSGLGDSIDPSGANTKGIIYPDTDNKVDLDTGYIMAEGYTHGVVLGEHFCGQHILVAGCTNGITVIAGHHSCSIQHVTAEVCKNSINLDGTGDLAIFNYETEHFSGAGWYTFTSDIKQTSGATVVKIFNSNVVLSGVGRVTDNSYFVTTGSPAYKVLFGCGENVLSGSSLTGEVPNYSDAALIALGLGASDYIVYFNTDAGELQHWDGTGFFSLDKTPYTPTTPLVSDDFDRADSASSMGNTVVPGTAWVPGSGTWGIQSNKAYCPGLNTSGVDRFEMTSVNAASADIDLTCTVTFQTAGQGGVCFRYLNDNNTLIVSVSAADIKLWKVVAGTLTSLGQLGEANAVGVPIDIRVTAVGSAIEVFKNSVSAISVTDSTHISETRIGLAATAGPTYGGAVTWDNLSVLPG